MSFDPSDRDPGKPIGGRHHSPICVRDVSWHSQVRDSGELAFVDAHDLNALYRSRSS